MRKALLALLLSALGSMPCWADGAVFEATTTPTDFPILGWSQNQPSAAKAREQAERECNRVLTEKRAEGWNIGPCVPVKAFKDQCIAYARPKSVSYRSVTYFEVGETENVTTESARKLCAGKTNEVCVAQFMACDGKPPAAGPLPDIGRSNFTIAAIVGGVCLLLGSLGYLYFFTDIKRYFVPRPPAAAADDHKGMKPEDAPASAPGSEPPPTLPCEQAAGAKYTRLDDARREQDLPKSRMLEALPAPAEHEPVRQEPAAALHAARSSALQGREEGINTFISVARHIYRSKGQAAFDEWIAITLDALPDAEQKVMVSSLLRTVFDAESDAPK